MYQLNLIVIFILQGGNINYNLLIGLLLFLIFVLFFYNLKK